MDYDGGKEKVEAKELGAGGGVGGRQYHEDRGSKDSMAQGWCLGERLRTGRTGERGDRNGLTKAESHRRRNSTKRFVAEPVFENLLGWAADSSNLSALLWHFCPMPNSVHHGDRQFGSVATHSNMLASNGGAGYLSCSFG